MKAIMDHKKSNEKVNRIYEFKTGTFLENILNCSLYKLDHQYQSLQEGKVKGCSISLLKNLIDLSGPGVKGSSGVSRELELACLDHSNVCEINQHCTFLDISSSCGRYILP